MDGDHLDAVLGAWTRDTNRQNTNRQDTNGRDTNGRDTNGRDTSGRDTSRAAFVVDGTTLRGTVPGTGGAGVHLLAALHHTMAPCWVNDTSPLGTSEIASLAPLLDLLPLTDVVITAAALHTTRDHVHYLHRHGAHYTFTVKANQHRLHALLGALPWHRTSPRTMASLRNLTSSALHPAGHTNIARPQHHTARDTNRPLQLLGITP